MQVEYSYSCVILHTFPEFVIFVAFNFVASHAQGLKLFICAQSRTEVPHAAGKWLFDIVDEQFTQARYQFEDLLDKSLSKLGIVSVNQRAKDLLTRCSHSIAYSLSIHPFKQFGCCLIADLAAVDRQLSDLPARDLLQAFQEIADSRSLG